MFSYKLNDSSYLDPVYVKKLFYLQLPVSVHYSPADNFSVGLELQYSHYGKGIVQVGDSNAYIGSLSGFPMIFVEQTEFRSLISLDYTYRNWVLGTSYDEAFTRAITVRVPNPAANPQAGVLNAPPPVRNSSLQLYLRYILWDGRKKKPWLPAE